MVNLRSRKLHEKSTNMELETPRRRRASSVQADSPRRARSVSEEPERRDSPNPSNQRKSLRLNSPLVLSKTVKSKLFAGGSEEGMTRPAPIIEEKSESPSEGRDRTLSKNSDSGKEDVETTSEVVSPVFLLKDIKINLFAGDSKRSASPGKEKRVVVKGRERNISDYFYSGREEDKTKGDASSSLRLKDVYASILQAVDSGERKRRPASPNKERSGSLVKGNTRKISDFFYSGKEDAKTDSDTSGVLSKDDKSRLTTGDCGEGKRSALPNKDKSDSPLKGKGKKISDGSDSSKHDAKTKSESSPTRCTRKSDPQPGIRSPRISTKSVSDPTSVSSDNQGGETERLSPTRLKDTTPTLEKRLAKRLSRKSGSGKEDTATKSESSPTRITPKNDPQTGIRSSRITGSGSDTTFVCSDNREEKTEGMSPTRLKEKSPSPDKRSAKRLSRKSDSGGGSVPDDNEEVVEDAQITSQSPRRQMNSGSESLCVVIPKEELKSPRRNDKSLSPDKGRVEWVSVTSLSKDKTPAEVTPKPPRKPKKSGSDRLSAADGSSETDDVSMSSPGPAVRKNASPQTDEPYQSVVKKGDVLQQRMSPVKTQSNIPPKKRWNLKVSGSSDAAMEQGPSTIDSSAQGVDRTGESPRSQLKIGSASEVRDSDSDRTWISPAQPKAERKSRNPSPGPTNPKAGDDVAAVQFKTPESTDKKRKESGSESAPESAGLLIHPPKKVVGSPALLNEPMEMDWEPSKTPDTTNEGNPSVETKNVSDFKDESFSTTPRKSKNSRRRRKSGSERCSVSSEFQVPSLDKDVNSSLVHTKDSTSLENDVKMKDTEKKPCTKEVSDGFESPNVPGKKKRPDRRRKSGSENKQVLDGSTTTKTEAVFGDNDVSGKGTSKKHKNKKNHDAQKMKAPEPLDEIRAKDYSFKMGDSEVTVRRRGGGTIIESRPVFSDDAKYVYVNCGWGVRVFSIETGECVRVFDAYSKDHKVVACFCWKSCPAALTSEGLFIAWDPRSGRVHQKVRLNVQELVVDGFFFSVGPEIILCLVLETKTTTQLRVYSGTTFKSQQHHPLNSRLIGHPYNLHRLSVGGNPARPFIAFLSNKNELKIINMKNRFFTTGAEAGAKKHWTCVQCHPREETVALGDSIGRIVVYRIARVANENQLVPAVYHWHTLPVSDIAFTPAGASMYSGGGELTLVKWNLENPHIKNYLPRLSAEIVHIAISPYNQMVAIATLDNGIQIVAPNNRLHCVLQQLSWSVFAGEQEGMFPAGLIYDPRSRGLMLNGRPGHLQLYSPLSETLTCNIDVTMTNYLTQERDKVIVNTHVTHSALTSDGLWLATIETRYEPGLALELKLKFWEYVVDQKRYALATVIDMPHDGKVHTIKFSPGPTGSASNDDVGPDHEVILASTGADKKLRLWFKTSIDSIFQKGSTWRCQNACFYRDRSCGPCSFSFDGSLLAVGFSSVLTLWDVDNVVLKHTIARDNEELKFVEFGRDDCCHIVMCATNSNIVAWNLLTLSLVWKVEMGTALFVPDPYSYFFAVFTVENQWKILDAHNGEVAFTMNSDGKSEVGDQLAKSQVLAAVFAPRHRPNPDAPQWMKNSYLYYVDIYQELNCLEPANEIFQLPTFQLALDKDAGTPFGSLVGAKSVREATDEELTKQAVGYGVLGSQAVTQLLRPPAHTLPPVSLLCGSFLQTFVIMKRDSPHEHEDKSEDDKTTVVASSDSEGEAKKSTKSEKSHKPRKRKQKHKKTILDRTNGLDKKNRLDEPMETESIDLRKHFPPLDEDDAESRFVIDD